MSSHTIVKADFWKLGQVKAGNTLKYRRVSLEDALSVRRDVENFVDQIVQCCARGGDFSGISPLKDDLPPARKRGDDGYGSALVHQIPEKGNQPLVSYRQVRKDFTQYQTTTDSFPGWR